MKKDCKFLWHLNVRWIQMYEHYFKANSLVKRLAHIVRLRTKRISKSNVASYINEPMHEQLRQRSCYDFSMLFASMPMRVRRPKKICSISIQKRICIMFTSKISGVFFFNNPNKLEIEKEFRELWVKLRPPGFWMYRPAVHLPVCVCVYFCERPRCSIKQKPYWCIPNKNI